MPQCAMSGTIRYGPSMSFGLRRGLTLMTPNCTPCVLGGQPNRRPGLASLPRVSYYSGYLQIPPWRLGKSACFRFPGITTVGKTAGHRIGVAVGVAVGEVELQLAGSSYAARTPATSSQVSVRRASPNTTM